MDAVALEILRQGLRKDANVLGAAVAAAREQLDNPHSGHLEACAYQLNRAFNVLEKAFERVCVSFENHFQKGPAYHEDLIERMTLELPGIRPRFLPPEQVVPVRDLKGFRHVFRHAYELELQEERLRSVVAHAESIQQTFPEWCNGFFAEIELDVEGD